MAVPTSGTLTMLGLAQEALYGTYGSGTITSPIHMYDLVNGGNSAGSGNTYPAVNQNCLPNPANRTALTLPNMLVSSEPSFYVTLYYNANIGDASNLVIGDILYTNSALTTLATGTSYMTQAGSSATTTYCSSTEARINTNSSGEIYTLYCLSLP